MNAIRNGFVSERPKISFYSRCHGMVDSVDLIIPASKHKAILTWFPPTDSTAKRKARRRPTLRRRFRIWSEETIGAEGTDWKIVMISRGGGNIQPDYAIRCPRLKAIMFKLYFL
jgi:hypothetical protein